MSSSIVLIVLSFIPLISYNLLNIVPATKPDIGMAGYDFAINDSLVKFRVQIYMTIDMMENHMLDDAASVRNGSQTF